MPLKVLSADAAFGNLRANPASRWPDGRKSNNGRLGLYAQPVVNPKFTFGGGDTILTIGSCFAREIEKRLVELGFDVPLTGISVPREERASETANDIVNKYVPHAMANELRWAFDKSASFPEAAYLNLGGGEWHDPHLGANLKPGPLDRVKARRAHVIDVYQRARNAKIVVITLGLVEAWFDNEVGLYLNAAPPLPAIKASPKRFSFHLLSYEDILAALDDIHGILAKGINPDFKIIITVSPVPFKATFTGVDALQANMYSKSVLRTAAESFALRYSNVDYFPSYEIVALSNRNVAYTMDNIHVQEGTVRRIMDHVVRNYTGQSPVDVKAGGVKETMDSLLPVNMFNHARELAKAKDYLAASKVLRDIDETFGDDKSGVSPAEFHLSFGVFLLRAKQTVAGEVEVRKAVSMNPKSARANYKHGLALARLKQHDEAIMAFRRAIDLSPEMAEYRWRLGAEYMKLGKLDVAAAELHKALELDPTHESAILALEKLPKR
ncbi:MAG TPA: GSCFA domain-containing protein [Thiobacillaceae bacterium]|nr:GSCFA domain-containing protein [Thiobacillaceae bacterium]HNI06697.1 GSCFA domain-containing protein [Thiobacillaceae bacterium]